MRTVTDAEGNSIEIPDEEELAAIKAKAEAAESLEKQIKDMEDRSAGFKNLREAHKRKDDQIASMKAEMEEIKRIKEELEAKTKDTEKKEDDVEVLSKEEIESMSERQTIATLVKLEINREISGLEKADQEKVKKYYDKLITGEQVNLDNVHSFIADAKRAALPTQSSSSVRGISSGGRGPRGEEKKEGFGETPEGKAFAAQMGLIIEPPQKK